MGYAGAASAATRVINILNDMLAANGSCEWITPNPSKLAYQIREAFAAVKKHPEFSKYVHLSEKFIVRVKEGRVVAEIRTGNPEYVFKQTLSKMVAREITSVEGAIGAAISTGAAELVLPDLHPNNEQLKMLYGWSQKNSWFIIWHHEAGITLTKTDPGEIKWTPEWIVE